MVGDGLFDEINGTAGGLESWRSLIWGSKPAFHGVSMADGDRSFEGRLTRNILDRVSTHLIEVQARHHLVQRTPKHIEDTADPYYVVIFQLAGTSIFRQGGQRSLLAPGDFTVSLSTAPYLWQFPDEFSVYMLIFPRALIDAPPRAFLSLSGRSLRSEGEFGGYLVPFVSSLARDPDLLRGPLGHRVARNVVDLVSTGLVSEINRLAPEKERPSLALFQQITEHIAQNLGDPDLGPVGIARDNYISVRHLQGIFQVYGTTVSSWVKERRLANVRHDLGDPLFAGQRISDLAARWGFVDRAYFSRCFRTTFGESPKQWRTRALAGRGTLAA